MRAKLVVAALASGALACSHEGATAPLEASFGIAVNGGDGQRGPAGSILPQPFSVLVKDAAGLPVKGARVVFRVERGAATGSRMLDSVGVTGPDGTATARLQLGSALDTTTVTAFPAPASQRSVRFVAVGSAAPLVTAVTPATFGAGDTITVRGAGLGITGSNGGVDFDGVRAAPVPGGSDGAIRAVVPACLTPGSMTVRAVAGTVRSNGVPVVYQSRSLPVTFAPYQAITVRSAQLADCLTLAGNGATYLVVAQFASTGSAVNAMDWRLGANLPSGTLAGAPASLRAHDGLAAQREFDAFLRNSERLIAPRARAEAGAARATRASLQGAAAAATPPALGGIRSFHVVARIDGTSFATVTTRLRYAGQHLLLYVDTVGSGFTDEQYQALGALFDRDLYPLGVAAFGSESDVDHDGRILAVFTPQVNSLVRAQDCLQRGFVTGFFYPTDLLLDDPNSNKAEIFYSFIPDSAARFSCAHRATDVLRFILPSFLHELQHMISFNQHVIARGGATEEVWLNEGLGHIAEELGSKYYEARFPPPAGRLTNTQIFPDSSGPFIAPQLLNAYVYLNATREHSVTSYQGTGSLEERGATWLFLRWLGEQKGDDIFRRLVQTSNVGTANVEAQSAETFGALFGDFSVALFADSLPDLPRSNVPPRFQFGSRQLRKLMAREAVVSGFTNPFPLPLYALRTGGFLQSAMLSGTMIHTLLRTAPGDPPVSLRFTRQDLSAFPVLAGAQVTIFRLPP
ncbi:MAG TPA: IPT/TIG domain-containing protein [Gemmatimonadaceae bacterium]|nr:IPT/TIG domain-containing protein [Gemmatimonadaceae bacterium]